MKCNVSGSTNNNNVPTNGPAPILALCIQTFHLEYYSTETPLSLCECLCMYSVCLRGRPVNPGVVHIKMTYWELSTGKTTILLLKSQEMRT